MITFCIGRSPENTIVYNEPSISGKHAELTVCDDGRIIFRDYSTNCTYVNGQFVNQNTVAVSFGDSIIFPGNIPFDWNIVSNALSSAASQPQQQPQGYEQPIQQGGGYSSRQPASSSPASGTWPANRTALNFSQTFHEAFSIGFGHVGTCGGALLLWLLTCWIPYINLGTFFGLQGMVNAWAKGEPFKATDIFDSKYRRMLPELLLGGSFRWTILLISTVLLVVPAFVLAIATMFSTLIMIDREYSPVDAIRESNRITYGSKWTIFGAQIVIALIFGVASGIIGGIFGIVGFFSPAVSIVLAILELLIQLFVVMPVSYGMTASMWKQLSANIGD